MAQRGGHRRRRRAGGARALIDATRLAIGALLAAAVAGAAHRARSLSVSGAVAAWVVGTLAVAAGWTWAALLLTFFVGGSLLSRVGAAGKARRLAGVVEKGGERDAAQVLANGGIFALAAAAHLASPSAAAVAVAAGALAAASADTFATEVGTAVGRAPRSILTGRVVPAGMSGGVTAAGSAAMLAGAGVIAAAAWIASLPHGVVLGAFAGGVAGALADSVLGAAVQERRRCDACGAATEQRAHDCGGSTRRVGGVPGVGNDAVNVACTAVGGLLAAWASR